MKFYLHTQTKKQISLIFILSCFLWPQIGQSQTKETTAPTEVSSLTELRNQETNGTTIYKVTSEVTFTYRGGRNILVQDVNAGILIYNTSPATFPTTLIEGDVITNIYGTLSKNTSGILQLIPTEIPSAVIRNEGKVTPINISMATLLADFSTYESRLVKLSEVTFGPDKFSVPYVSRVTMKQGSSSMKCYDMFSNLSSFTPPANADVTGFPEPNKTDFDFAVRNKTDFKELVLPSITISFPEEVRKNTETEIQTNVSSNSYNGTTVKFKSTITGPGTIQAAYFDQTNQQWINMNFTDGIFVYGEESGFILENSNQKIKIIAIESGDYTILNEIIRINDNKTLSTQTTQLKVVDKISAQITTQVPQKISRLEEHEFSVNYITGDYAGENVKKTFKFTNAENIELFYKTSENESWTKCTFDAQGTFIIGGEAGLPLSQSTIYFKIKFLQAASYDYTFNIISATDNKILAESKGQIIADKIVTAIASNLGATYTIGNEIFFDLKIDAKDYVGEEIQVKVQSTQYENIQLKIQKDGKWVDAELAYSTYTYPTSSTPAILEDMTLKFKMILNTAQNYTMNFTVMYQRTKVLTTSSNTFTAKDGSNLTSLSELKTMPADGTTIYKITSEVTYTFRNARNIFLQDASTGIIVYNTTTTIFPTTLVNGDVISNICGTLSKTATGVFQLTPTEAPTAVIRNDGPVNPVEISMTDLLSDFSKYESKLVQLSDVTCDNVKFSPPYTSRVKITQGTSSMNCYDMFGMLSNYTPPTNADITGFPEPNKAAFDLVVRAKTDFKELTAPVFTVELPNEIKKGIDTEIQTSISANSYAGEKVKIKSTITGPGSIQASYLSQENSQWINMTYLDGIYWYPENDGFNLADKTTKVKINPSVNGKYTITNEIIKISTNKIIAIKTNTFEVVDKFSAKISSQLPQSITRLEESEFSVQVETGDYQGVNTKTYFTFSNAENVELWYKNAETNQWVACAFDSNGTFAIGGENGTPLAQTTYSFKIRLLQLTTYNYTFKVNTASDNKLLAETTGQITANKIVSTIASDLSTSYNTGKEIFFDLKVEAKDYTAEQVKIRVQSLQYENIELQVQYNGQWEDAKLSYSTYDYPPTPSPVILDDMTLKFKMIVNEPNDYAITFSIIYQFSKVLATSTNNFTATLPPAEITVNPTSLDFQETFIGTNKDMELTLNTNNNNVVLQVSSSDNNIFEVSQQTINFEESTATLNVKFKPTEAQEYTGTITLSDAALNITKTVAVKGTGVEAPKPQISVNPDKLVFAEVEVGSSKTLELNITPSNLKSDLSITSANPQFTVNPSVINMNATTVQTVTVTFNPIAVQDYSTIININGTELEQVSIPVEGKGIKTPTISINPETLNTFATTVGTPATQQTLTVTGSDLTENISIIIEGTNASIFTQTTGTSWNNLTGGTLNVGYNPNVAGTHTATLKITSGLIVKTISLQGNATNKTLNAPLAKNATDITENSFTANWETVEGATSYLLTVVEGDITTTKELPTELEVTGTSYEVTELKEKTKYSYYLIAKDNDIVSIKSNIVKVETMTNIEELIDNSIIYTSENKVVINLGKNIIASVSIYDLNGKTICQQQTDDFGQAEIQVNTPTGTYIVLINTGDETFSKKVIIK